MRLDIIDSLSLPSPFAAVNEDAVGTTDSAAWVIDGATGVADRLPLVEGLTDAAWLAERLNEQLHAAFEKTPADPVAALAEVDAEIRAQFLALDPSRESTAAEQPTAAFSLLTLTDATVRLLGVADCRIIIETHDGELRTFNPSDSGAAESLIIKEQRRLLAAYPGEDPWPRLKSLIREMRAFANVEGGYSVVHPTRPWSNRATQQAHDARDIKHLLAASDGFYRLVDVFRVMQGPEQLLKSALTHGLEQLCSELRELELGDERCMAYPRVKPCDDASAILVRLS